MKRLLVLMLLMLLAFPAAAEVDTFTGRVRRDMPELTVAVTQTGDFDDDAHRPYPLTAPYEKAAFPADQSGKLLFLFLSETCGR